MLYDSVLTQISFVTKTQLVLLNIYIKQTLQKKENIIFSV